MILRTDDIVDKKEMELVPGESDILSFHSEFEIHSEKPMPCRPNCDLEKKEFLNAVMKAKDTRENSGTRNSTTRLSLTGLPPAPPAPLPAMARELEELRTIELAVNLSAAEMVIAVLRNGKMDSFDLKGEDQLCLLLYASVSLSTCLSIST
jgi:hypothetical protein